MAILQDSYSRHILSPDQYALRSRQCMQELAIRCVVGKPITVTAPAATTAVAKEQVCLPRRCALCPPIGDLCRSNYAHCCMLHSRIIAAIHRRVISTSRVNGHHTRRYLPPRARTSTSLRQRLIVRCGGRLSRSSTTGA